MGQTLTETTGIQGILNRAMPIYLQDVDGGICKKLGYTRSRTRNVEAINASMALALAKTKCPGCGGQLKQTRSGARRAQCTQCGKRYQLKKGTR